MQIGVLLQVVDAFAQVFQSLAIAMNDWAAVNEFRSVCRRLVEFEAMLPAATTIDAAGPAADGRALEAEEFESLYHAVGDDEL